MFAPGQPLGGQQHHAVVNQVGHLVHDAVVAFAQRGHGGLDRLLAHFLRDRGSPASNRLAVYEPAFGLALRSSMVFHRLCSTSSMRLSLISFGGSKLSAQPLGPGVQMTVLAAGQMVFGPAQGFRGDEPLASRARWSSVSHNAICAWT